MKKRLAILTIVFFFVLLQGGCGIMTEYDIQMGQRNADNTEWNNYYPVTKGHNVKMESGLDVESVLTLINSRINNLGMVKNVAYVDQYISGFYGRGQLAEEKLTENQFTEQNLTASALAGIGTINVTDGTKFVLGSVLMIQYDDGTYFPHFIRTKTNNTLGILPPLQKNVTTNTKVERGWYNSAHPGKFYMRYLAQRLATDLEDASGYGERLFYANFDGFSNDDIGIALGGTTIGYNESRNKDSTYGSPLESCIGKTAFFETSVIGGGIKLPTFTARKGERLVLRMFAMSRVAGNTTKISVKTSEGVVVKSIDITGATSQIMKPYVFDFIVPHNADRLYVDIVNQTAIQNVFFIDEVQVLRGVGRGTILPSSAKIVGFGDSWVAGDLASTAERESMLTHLQTLLPNAEIINKGHGGDKIQDLHARFETEIVPLNPDVVIVNVGTNDAYNPASATFDPNSIDYYDEKMKELINKIIEIGAKPVVISPPALAEEDGSATGFLLNDRSRAYAKRMNAKIFKYDYGKPTVQKTELNRYGKLEHNNIYLSGNNFKDVTITTGDAPIPVKRIRIMAKAFDDATPADVTLKIYNSTRDTILATSNVVKIIKGSAIQPFEFVLPDILTLTASTDYILAFEGTNLWTVIEGGSGTIKNYGMFTVTNFIQGNTTPPTSVRNKWMGVLLIPPVGIPKVFIDNMPNRYKVSPELSMFDENGNVNIFDDKNRLLLSFYANIGEEFVYED